MAHKVSTGEALRTGFFQTRNFSERRLVWGWWHWASRFLLHQEPWAYVRFDSRVAFFIWPRYLGGLGSCNRGAYVQYLVTRVLGA